MRELIARYPDLVIGIAAVDHRIREGIEQYKATFLLADGSLLRMSEVRIDDRLVKYSYYWLNESNHVIAGWDNAPHHPQVASYPHHTHIATGVRDSSIRSLEDVLVFLAKRILGE
ncbi:MAG: hypothetical protein JW850_02435 [Thermoflexales bacterium]|nr:hypothetical protein [Thermoflexales bacterium]